METFAPLTQLILLLMLMLLVASMFLMGIIGTAISAWKWCKRVFAKVKHG